MHYQIPKGLFDILPYGESEEWRLSHAWQHVEKVMRKLSLDYGYQEIRTPIFEHTDLFQRGVGSTSDIVSKEMYTFEDKGGRSLCLRPEGTSSVMRAIVENGLLSFTTMHKLYYIGPMFRYERPQGGRYRQHHQFGVEALGSYSYELDAEIIDMLYELYRRLGIKKLTVMINSIGDIAAREAYRKALQDFLRPNFSKLSEDSKTRFEKNPLRILDSKDPQDQELLANSPSLLEFLSIEEKKHFQALCQTLTAIHVPYQINDRIVRGLDYYNKTVFEIVSSDLGAQSTIGAGGRYDGFTTLFGGPSLPGIGFATGIERILQTMIKQELSFPWESAPFIFFIPLGENAKRVSFTLATQLRHLQIPTEVDYEAKKIQTSLQRANRAKVSFAIIIGDEELQSEKAKIKHMEKREEEEVSLNSLIEVFEKKGKQRTVARFSNF